MDRNQQLTWATELIEKQFLTCQMTRAAVDLVAVQPVSRALTPCPSVLSLLFEVAFRIYDVDGDGLVSSVELYRTLQQLVGNNFSDAQLEQVRALQGFIIGGLYNPPRDAAQGGMRQVRGYTLCGAEACTPLPMLKAMESGGPAHFVWGPVCPGGNRQPCPRHCYCLC